MSHLLEDEVFVRAYCASLSALVRFRSSQFERDLEGSVQRTATAAAEGAVEAWRNRRTKPGTKRASAPAGSVEDELRERNKKLRDVLDELLEAHEDHSGSAAALSRWTQAIVSAREAVADEDRRRARE